MVAAVADRTSASHVPASSGFGRERAWAITPPALPDVATRQQVVVDLFGTDCLDAELATFRAVLIVEVERLFQRVVLQAVRPVWPGVDTAPFFAKWRGGFELYCSLALSSMVCAARRPKAVVVVSAAARALGLDEASIATVGRKAMPLLFRVLEPRACARAALVSAWILVLDEALDDGLTAIPLKDRPAVLAAAARGTIPDDLAGGATPELRAVHALGIALRKTLRDDEDAAHFNRVLEDVDAWARGEVKNLLGEPDPLGVCHRTIVVTASMDLLGWAVSPHAGPKEHEFLYRVAELGQMLDDWLDVDKDRGQGRTTPVTTGAWTPQTMKATYDAGERLLRELAHEGGEPDGPWSRLVQRTFRGQIQQLVRCLTDNP